MHGDHHVGFMNWTQNNEHMVMMITFFFLSNIETFLKKKLCSPWMENEKNRNDKNGKLSITIEKEKSLLLFLGQYEEYWKAYR